MSDSGWFDLPDSVPDVTTDSFDLGLGDTNYDPQFVDVTPQQTMGTSDFSATTAPPASSDFNWQGAANLASSIGKTFAQDWQATHPPAPGAPVVSQSYGPTSPQSGSMSPYSGGGVPATTPAGSSATPAGFNWAQLKDFSTPYPYALALVGLTGLVVVARSVSRR